MNITIEMPMLITIGITVVGGILAIVGWLFRMLIQSFFKQFEEKLEGKFETLRQQFRQMNGRLDTIEADAKEWNRLERELLTLKADMPLQYVRREDYVRNQAVIESKLDAVALKFENWQLKETAKK